MPADSGRYPSGQRGQTVNLLANAFGGSNPPLPTTPWLGMEKCGNSSAVERQPSKLGVAGSNPVSRSRLQREPKNARRRGNAVRAEGRRRGPSRLTRAVNGFRECAHVAQTAERVLGKDEVSGSITDMGSIFFLEIRALPLNPKR